MHKYSAPHQRDHSLGSNKQSTPPQGSTIAGEYKTFQGKKNSNPGPMANFTFTSSFPKDHMPNIMTQTM